MKFRVVKYKDDSYGIQWSKAVRFDGLREWWHWEGKQHYSDSLSAIEDLEAYLASREVSTVIREIEMVDTNLVYE